MRKLKFFLLNRAPVLVRCDGVAVTLVRSQSLAATQCAGSGHPNGGITHSSYSQLTWNSPVLAR